MRKDLILYTTAASCYKHNDGETLQTLAREGKIVKFAEMAKLTCLVRDKTISAFFYKRPEKIFYGLFTENEKNKMISTEKSLNKRLKGGFFGVFFLQYEEEEQWVCL